MEGKGSPLHRAVQKHIYQLLPEGETRVEYRLPGHIADLVWLPKKIVFEIQCSPISVDTAIARTNDYRTLGFFIVWVLHQKNFNSSYLSLAELYLRKQKNCYYTNISHSGHGYVYNQEEQIRNNKRIWRSKELPIDLKNPTVRRKKLYFPGDIPYTPQKWGGFKAYAPQFEQASPSRKAAPCLNNRGYAVRSKFEDTRVENSLLLRYVRYTLTKSLVTWYSLLQLLGIKQF